MTVGEVFRDSINSVTGLEFWSRISDYGMHYQSWEILQNSKRNKHWAKAYEDEMVVTSVDPSRDQFHVQSTDSSASPTTFGVNLVVAKYFGLVEESRAGGYNLGRNARYACHPTFETQLAMVYCDVVESSLVGNQKHALLRKLMLKDSGGQRQFVEPLHYQWLSVRNNVIEVVHVQVADADGKLLALPSGKTMVTVTLKRSA